LLTLLIVPVLYTYLYRLTERIKAARRRAHERHAEAHGLTSHAKVPEQPTPVTHES
jgi:hypothetical protein